MKKKLLIIFPILIVLVGNLLLNSWMTDSAIKYRAEKAAEEKAALASPSPSPTPRPSPKASPTPKPSPSPTPDPRAEEKALGQQIADYALGFWGAKYKYGGDSLAEGGFDCSGLVYHCYGKFGYSLQRVASEQAKQGVEVPPEELEPGDVLCFYTSGKYVGHVGIYVGNNHYIHAMGEAYGVVVTALDNPDLQRDFTARRYVGCEELKSPAPASAGSPALTPAATPTASPAATPTASPSPTPTVSPSSSPAAGKQS